MKSIQLLDLDLNLLATLDAIMVEGSAQRAAVRLGVTQSAISHALRRLRDHLGDPLVVRSPRGMVPTTRGAQLARPLRQALADLDDALRGQHAFDPRVAVRTFTLSSADYTELVLVPLLAKHLMSAAPGVKVIFRSPREDLTDDLEAGRIDLALGVFHGPLANCRKQAIFHDRFVCVVRKDHPMVRRGLTLDRYLELQHVAIAPRTTGSGTLVDHVLLQHGHRRRVTMVVPHFMVAPIVVSETDLMLTSPERIALRYRAMLPLKVLAPPFQLPGFTISQVWHERVHKDPGHAWLRSTIARLI